jgi:hypothetical protein
MKPMGDSFDLTPSSVRRQKAAITVLSKYLIAIILLVGLLSGLCLMRVQERNVKSAALYALMNEAVPVRDMRLETLKLQQRNQQLASIVDAVATAEPRDSLLQTFADATTGFGTSGVVPKEIHIRLAVEAPGSRTDNSWASSTLRMTVEAIEGSLLPQAHETLRGSKRLGEVETLGLIKIGDLTRSEITATPRAEVLLP